MPDTAAPAYARRLARLQGAWWKRVLPVQAPYRGRVRRLVEGPTLEIGCGIGRLLPALPPGSVGLDHNLDAVLHCRRLGLPALPVAEFDRAAAAGTFGTLLAAHLVEHLEPDAAVSLLREYLPCLRPGGRVVLICPQQRGQASDPTHRTLFDADRLRDLLRALGVTEVATDSFPLPLAAGRWFVYNETLAWGRVSR